MVQFSWHLSAGSAVGRGLDVIGDGGVIDIAVAGSDQGEIVSFQGTSKSLLRDQSAAKRGARNLAYLHDMSRFLCSVRLASWPAHNDF